MASYRGEASTKIPHAAVNAMASHVAAAEAGAQWERIASANWLATAALAARAVGEGVLVDLGSTTADILLLAGGEVDGVRVLSEESVQSMRTDRLTPEQKSQNFLGAPFWIGRGFGLNLSLVTDEAKATPFLSAPARPCIAPTSLVLLPSGLANQSLAPPLEARA